MCLTLFVLQNRVLYFNYKSIYLSQLTSLMPHVQKTSTDSFLCDQKRNKIFTQTKWDTMLSFMTVCTYT